MAIQMTTAMNSKDGLLSHTITKLWGSQFIRWWIGELQSMVPDWLRPRAPSLDGVRQVLLDEIDNALPTLRAQERMVLLVPTSKVLRKVIHLPLAAEENLRQVLEYQMDQYTPFEIDQVYFVNSIESRDFQRGRLSVMLTVVHRGLIDACVAKLRHAGIVPAGVFPQSLSGEPSGLNLLPSHVGGSVDVGWHRSPTFAMAVVVLLLALIAWALPLVIKREAAIQILPFVEQARKAATAVDDIRRDLDVRIERHNFLIEKRRSTPTLIETLEDLTRVLPDDTWVRTLDLKGKEIVIQGETASSVKLVGLFEQSNRFKDATFRTPLVKGQTQGVEIFSLALKVRQPAQVTTPIQAASAPAPTASAPTAPAPNAAGGKARL